MSDCHSAYTVWPGGLTLHCTGEHLRGNIRRGTIHQAQAHAGGVSWTWYEDEADQTREVAQ